MRSFSKYKTTPKLYVLRFLLRAFHLNLLPLKPVKRDSTKCSRIYFTKILYSTLLGKKKFSIIMLLEIKKIYNNKYSQNFLLFSGKTLFYTKKICNNF